jgi:hypothetical protein
LFFISDFGNSVTDTGNYMPDGLSRIRCLYVVGVDDEAVRQLYADANRPYSAASFFQWALKLFFHVRN